jgi:hypothetical protein
MFPAVLDPLCDLDQPRYGMLEANFLAALEFVGVQIDAKFDVVVNWLRVCSAG